jgi:hypothetical protein
MKRLIRIRFAIAYTLFFFITIGFANAQKQPQVQEVSVLAPASVKIDGQLNEWQNPYINVQKYTGFLSAFNSSSRIYYTVANDDKNLYLVVRALGNGVSKKILAGGLTFTITHTAERKGKIKDPSNVVINFPVPLDAKTTSFIMSTINQIQDFTGDSVANRKSIDSLDAIADKMVNNATKEIHITGLKDIPDSVVSIYNTQGIKAAIQFIQVQAAIEIAIPFKYLGFSVDAPAAFSYNIRINAIPEASRAYVTNAAAGGGTIDPADIPFNANNAYAWNPTDFWGEYILAKKP